MVHKSCNLPITNKIEDGLAVVSDIVEVSALRAGQDVAVLVVRDNSRRHHAARLPRRVLAPDCLSRPRARKYLNNNTK